jgi:putative DNA primase/helicase
MPYLNPDYVADDQSVMPCIDLSQTMDPVHDTDMPTPQLSDVEIIRQLAALKPFEYDKVRTAKAKELGIRPGTLDAEVKAIRGEDRQNLRLPFASVEPHPEPIAPAQVLNDVSATIKQFIVLDDHQAHAAALWCALTWFIDVVEVAPLAIINAPEKACGKTQLLTVMGRMSYRPLYAANATASALFRAVELWKPTILCDEADTFFRENPELHGLFNSGYAKGGGVLRSESTGDSFEPRVFSVYSAKALAGIKLEKHLPDATMSRGIHFNLRRKLSGETVSRLRHAPPYLFDEISSKLAKFSEDYSEQVQRATLVLSDELSDRQQDNWEALLAIASCAGSEWLAKATAAALHLSATTSDKTVSAGNELLSDIRDIFESKRIDKISTADLINALCEDEEAAWATYNRGRPLAPRQLVKQLEAYEIKPKLRRLNSYDNPVRGFEISQFNDAFMRYLTIPLKQPLHATNGAKATNDAAFTVTDSVTRNTSSIVSDTAQPTDDAACNTVADKTAFLGVGVNEPILEDVWSF